MKTEQTTTLLIYPPNTKATEPPPGLARLAGVLQANSLPHRLWDANLEGQLWLLEQPPTADDTWTTRAWRSRHQHLQSLRSPETYSNFGRYSSAVNDLNHLLQVAGKPFGYGLGLTDLRHNSLSPVNSQDLLHAAACPDKSVFHSFFQHRLAEIMDGVTTVGISLCFLSQALPAFSLIGLIRRDFPLVRILLGGGLVTSWLSHPNWCNCFSGLLDGLVSGPGEQHLLQFLGHNSPCTQTLPDYSQLPLQDYLSPGLILPYSSSSGCWWNRCSFCPEQAEGSVYSQTPYTKVTEELQQLVQQYQPTLLHLLDNAISPVLLKQLVQQPPVVDWYGFVRFGKELEDPEFCQSLRASGCLMLKLGIESGDQQVLDRLHKGIRLEQVSRILGNLHQAGIGVYGYLLFGTPTEDRAAAEKTLEFTLQHCHQINFLNLAIFNMPIYGAEVELYETEPFYEGDLSLYTGFRHPAGWGRGEVRRFLRQQFTKQPEIAAIIRRDPPYYSSNHAALFVAFQT